MQRTYTLGELMAAVRRRWMRATTIALALAALAALFIARVPDDYRAHATVMVEPETPHPDLIVPVLSTSLLDRVKSVRSQIYARGLMAPAIEELNLYPKEREKGGMDAALTALRNDTEVNADGDAAFTISVRARDAQTAAKVANRLAELFIEGNLAVRNGQVQRTAAIVGSKLDELRGQLAEAEQRISAFKKVHATELPELVESRMRERESMARQIEMDQGFIQAAQTRLDLLGTQPFGKDTEVGRLEDEQATLATQQTAAAAGLQPDHPDVARLARQMEDIGARLQRARARAAANDLELRRLNAAIARGRADIAQVQQRMAVVDRTIVAGPQIAAQLAEVSRDADLLHAKVAQMISKKAEAELAAELEQKNATSEFRVLEAAVPPSLPSGPNRPEAFALALLAALCIGGGLALGSELNDRSLRTSAEANGWLALPVLAAVPHLSGRTAGRMLQLPRGERASS